MMTSGRNIPFGVRRLDAAFSRTDPGEAFHAKPRRNRSRKRWQRERSGSQRVHRTDHSQRSLVEHMGINLGGLHMAVAE